MQNRTQRNFHHVAFVTSSFPCSGEQLTRVSRHFNGNETPEIDDATAMAIARPLMGRASMATNVTVDSHGNFDNHGRVEFNLGNDLLVQADRREAQLKLVDAMTQEIDNFDLRIISSLKGAVFHNGNVMPLYRQRTKGKDLVFEQFFPHTLVLNVTPNAGTPSVPRSQRTTKVTVDVAQYARMIDKEQSLTSRKDGRVMQRFLFQGMPVLAVCFPVVFKMTKVTLGDGSEEMIPVVQNADEAFVALIYGSTLDFHFDTAAYFGEEMEEAHKSSHAGMQQLFHNPLEDRARAIASANLEARQGAKLLVASIGDRSAAALTERQRRAIEAHKAKTEAAAAAPAADASPAEAPKAPKPRKPRPSKAPPADPVAAADAGVSESPADSSAPN